MVTVIGAGLGGLTLAAILHRRGIEVQVYDRDPSPAARRQGGMLDIHEHSGQAALRTAGLFAPFQALILPGGDAVRVLDQTGQVWIDRPGSGARPEVDRRELRALLLSVLPPACLHWGAQALVVTRSGPTGHTVHLADGRPVTAELVIGADGARSAVRAPVSDVPPAYTGISIIELRIPAASEHHPDLARLVGAGSLFALAPGRGILAHHEHRGTLCIYVALQVPADWSATATLSRPALLEYFPGWDPALRRLVSESSGDLAARPIYALPSGHRWDPHPGVTLIGDAAHLISPFAGEGANQAMQDGAELAQALLAHPRNVAAALAQFEPAMFARSQEAATASAAGLEMCLGPGAPGSLVDFFGSRPAGPEPPP